MATPMDQLEIEGARTNGLVCAHHHLYSALARGMPAPPSTPHNFIQVLEQVWWRLDNALDLDVIFWSAALGAAEALLSGTTAIIDHHESPSAIEGSLDAIANACDMIGVRSNLSYGVTDRWHNQVMDSCTTVPQRMTEGARRGLSENERFLRAGGRGMVGVHASFTCSTDTLQAASELASTFNTGVHIHVAEGPDDADAGARLENLTRDNWLLVHCVGLTRELRGTIAHNPRSNMNNSVGYANPVRFNNTVVLGTDGIGADMLEEARLGYVKLREADITQTPDTVWQWLQNGEDFFPEVKNDTVIWNYDHANSPWHVAFSPGIRPTDVYVDGAHVVKDGVPTMFDINEVRAKAAEAAAVLHSRL
jgi:cytosine/adenosine deaminase-related metal-dependent hydrolase